MKKLLIIFAIIFLTNNLLFAQNNDSLIKDIRFKYYRINEKLNVGIDGEELHQVFPEVFNNPDGSIHSFNIFLRTENIGDMGGNYRPRARIRLQFEPTQAGMNLYHYTYYNIYYNR